MQQINKASERVKAKVDALEEIRRLQNYAILAGPEKVRGRINKLLKIVTPLDPRYVNEVIWRNGSRTKDLPFPG